MRHIYSQMFDDLPDIGIIEYIGSKTNLNTVDWKLEGEKGKSNDKEIEKSKENCAYRSNSKGEIRYTDTNGTNQTRIMANIDAIKEIVNDNMYNDIAIKIEKSKCDCESGICYLTGKLSLYENYNNQEDVFMKVDEDCLWLKTTFLDTDVLTLTKILDEVNIIAYVIKTKKKDCPRILKAIAVYL